ncbi:MAG: tRNA 2-thiouridine(34) synthase MnmA [Clostridia bacterium]
MMDAKNTTVVVGMSGGVDSSVVAYLLKKQGYNTIGLFMNNWEEKDDSGCCTSADDYADVRRVASKIGIPYYSINFAKEYQDKVFSEFLAEYKAGRTPNPDVLCNREIKFGPFLNFAKSIGADKIATGHYCRVEEKEGLFYLKKAKDQNKDQTYFLNQLNQSQLSMVMFPIGEETKPTIRKIAIEQDFSTATKKDSTGICFIGERKFKEFLKNYIPASTGNIVDKRTNEILWHHDGVMYYTLGQRKGLGIGGRNVGTGESWFVVDKDVKNNILYVTQGEGSELYSSACVVNSLNWIPRIPTEKTFDCFAKFRYRQLEQAVSVHINDDGSANVIFKEKQRAVTPGQYAVFYSTGHDDYNGYCLGGGVIDKVIF